MLYIGLILLTIGLIWVIRNHNKNVNSSHKYYHVDEKEEVSTQLAEEKKEINAGEAKKRPATVRRSKTKQ